MMGARKRSVPSADRHLRGEIKGWGEGWSGRGEEGESQGPLFPTPAPHTHTLWWPCLRPPLPGAYLLAQ